MESSFDNRNNPIDSIDQLKPAQELFGLAQQLQVATQNWQVQPHWDLWQAARFRQEWQSARQKAPKDIQPFAKDFERVYLHWALKAARDPST